MALRETPPLPSNKGYWSHCFSPAVDYWSYCPTPHFPLPTTLHRWLRQALGPVPSPRISSSYPTHPLSIQFRWSGGSCSRQRHRWLCRVKDRLWPYHDWEGRGRLTLSGFIKFGASPLVAVATENDPPPPPRLRATSGKSGLDLLSPIATSLGFGCSRNWLQSQS